jgi:G protein-coupled receptor kinase
MEIDSHIEGIIADTALTEAYKYKRRSKKWRKLIKIPHISQCEELVATYSSKEYDFIVQKQPIGRELFTLFCLKTCPLYSRCQSFLQAVHDYELCEDADQINSLNNILWTFLGLSQHEYDISFSSSVDFTPQFSICDDAKTLFANKRNFINLISREALETVDNSTKNAQSIPNRQSSDIFLDCTNDVRQYLSGEPFEKFKKSMYFYRYLQWVWLEQRPITDEHFYVFRTLGKGGFGEVCACQNRISGKMFACKRFDKKKIKKHKREKLMINEKKILEMLHSDFVVNLAYAFQTQDELCLIQALLMGGTLHFHIKFLHSNKKTGKFGLSESNAKFYAAEILLGLRDLHSYKIVHRDIKPENILMDEWGHIRISDLGLAKEILNNEPITGGGGTKGYIAPEVTNKEPYTYSPDFYSFGCVIYEMIEGKQYKRVKELSKNEEKVYSTKFSIESMNLCKLLLKSNMKMRIGCSSNQKGAHDVMNHSWFSSVNWKRMERLKETPPVVPNPNIVYASNVGEFVTTHRTNLKGIKIKEEDEELHNTFNTGAVSVQWQEEMIETGIFQDLNVFGANDTLPKDLDINYVKKASQQKKGKFGSFRATC